jgi:hypothetical protein
MLLAVLAFLAAQVVEPVTSSSRATTATIARAERANALERVAIIGASVSHGHRAPPGWQAAFEASLSTDNHVVANAATSMVFLGPKQYAAPQIELALAQKPTLVLAVDFLFWFGYGTKTFDGDRIETEAERLALLDAGLALLDKIECPLVVGDFPDMTQAAGVMLRPEQLPQRATIEQLNARLAEWAKSKKNVVLVPLAAWARDLLSRKTLVIGSQTYEPSVTAKWIQPDRLHPTAEGLAALATLVDVELATAKLERETDFIVDVARVYARMTPSTSSAPSAGK